MRLTVTTFVTLDGVMQSPGAPQEDPSNGFDLGGWLPPHFDEETGQYMNDVFDQAEAFLLGRRTYDLFESFWPNVSEPGNRVASQLNSLPKYVATRTRTDFSWKGTVPLGDDLAAKIAELKRAPGKELQVHGSGALVRSLMSQDLVDAYRLIVFPVVLGRGQRLFADGVPPTAMRLTGSRSTGRGVVLHTYEAAGRPAYGSVTTEDVAES
jgi:dihydrofolate reductase